MRALRNTSALLAALGIGALWGIVAASWTPRGPTTTTEALVTLGVSLGCGVAAGILGGSRWLVLLGPLTFLVAFELVRLPIEGPTVDTIQPTLYGLMAFASGRGFDAFLVLLPLALGAAVGAGLWRLRHGPELRGGIRRAGRVAGRTVAVLSAGVLVALAVGLAVPARTAAVAGGISEFGSVEVAGHRLNYLARGQDPTAPVLLYLAGGPGGSEYGAMRRHLQGLEEHFVVVTLDQRGTGTSYPALDPVDTYTLGSAIGDVIAVTEHLVEEYGTDRVLLVGQSWGTLLGVLAVQRSPELFSGYVGVGQMVDIAETDQIFFADTLAWAEGEGNTQLVAELERIGAPPYEDILNYETALTYEQQVYPYDHTGNSEGSGGFSENILVEEYSLLDKVHVLGAFLDTFAVLFPQLQRTDLRESATSLAVPVFFVQGAHEARGRSEPFEDWYPMLQAPHKERVTFERSGHRPLFEQPEEFVEYLSQSVLPRLAGS